MGIVVGAGQAGPALAVRCGEQGLKTAIIERKLFGGTCVNTGCVTTKTLIASARATAINSRTERAAGARTVLDHDCLSPAPGEVLPAARLKFPVPIARF